MGTFLDAAEIVLKRYRQPMTSRKVTNKARELRLLDDSNGKTPWHTMRARLSEDIKRYGKSSRFMRTERGVFALREFGNNEYKARPFEKSIKPTEDVLVFPTTLLRKVGWFHGIRKNFHEYAKVLLDHRNTKFLSRIDAETNESYKQVINYVLVKQGNRILRFVRGRYTSAQAMLKGQYCIGFGGHVESHDLYDIPLFSHIDSGYESGMLRELNEELNLPKDALQSDKLKMIGVLNDDSSQLGLLHFAFINLLDLSGRDLGRSDLSLKREQSINQLKFVPIDRLNDEFEKYEYWSKLCIKAFYGEIANVQPRIRCIRNFRLHRHKQNIAFVGSIGSGKTEACKLLGQEFDYSVLPTGHLVAELTGCPQVPQIRRKEFCEHAYKLISSHTGPEILANAIYKKLSESKKQHFVIDGLRQTRTFEILKKKLKGKLTLVYVDTMIDNAYDFLRQRESEELSLSEFADLVRHPVEREVEDFASLANIVIYNYGTRECYIDRVRDFFREELK